MVKILEILDVGSELAKVCPSVCSANSCYRASRVLYPTSCISFKVATLLDLCSVVGVQSRLVCVCWQDGRVMVTNRGQSVDKLEWPNKMVFFIFKSVSP